MMFLKRTAAAVLGGAILCTATAFAMDMKPVSQNTVPQATQNDTVAQVDVPVMAERELYYGTIKEIIRDEQSGAITGLFLDSEAKGEYIFHIDDKTMLFNSGEGIRATSEQLEVGKGVYVFHSTAATMSLPPQSYAEAVVMNIPADAGSAMLHTVEAVKKNEDGSVTVTTDRGGLLITIAKDAQYGDYLGRRMIMSADNLKVGTRFFTWYNAVEQSMPAQTTVNKVVIASAKEQEGLKIEVNGQALEATAKIQNDTLMIPVSATVKALGMEASYAKTENGEQVTLKNDKKKMVMDIGSDIYTLEGDMVMSYGAPAVIEEGTTWMPAQALADFTGAQLSLASGAVSFSTAK